MVTGSPNELAMGSPSKNFEAHQQIKIISIHNGSYVIWDYLEQFRNVPNSPKIDLLFKYIVQVQSIPGLHITEKFRYVLTFQ